MSSLKVTPLHQWHIGRGGRMIDFAGWHMPVQYSGIVDEVHAVRRAAGLFDVSHMGELRFRGADAAANVQRLVTNDVAALEPGRVQYTVMTNERGGIVDDVLVYLVDSNECALVVNAATTDKDFAWVREHAQGTRY